MKKYEELTFEEVDKTGSLSTISDIVRQFAINNLYWDRIDTDSKESAYSRVEYLVKNFSRVINGSFLIQMKSFYHFNNKIGYLIEDTNINDSEPRKNQLEEINKAFRSSISLYEINKKEVLGIAEKFLSSGIDLTMYICIENERVYVDERTFYFELWYNENISNNIIDKNEYKWLGKIDKLGLSEKVLGTLNIRSQSYITIRSCTIKTINIDTEGKRANIKNRWIIELTDCKVKEVNIKVEGKYININYNNSDIGKINLYIEHDKIKHCEENILPIIMMMPHKNKAEIKEINIYISESIVNILNKLDVQGDLLHEVIRFRTRLLKDEMGEIKTNLIVVKGDTI